jgi:hypothetical protein
VFATTLRDKYNLQVHAAITQFEFTARYGYPEGFTEISLNFS